MVTEPVGRFGMQRKTWLKARHPDAEYRSARPQERYDQVLVVCGCAARCADVSAIRGGQIRYICGGGPFQL